MAKLLVPSSFYCDCGHKSHFCENTIKEMEAASARRRKTMLLGDSEPEEHNIEFVNGKATAVICPRLGLCEITVWE